MRERRGSFSFIPDADDQRRASSVLISHRYWPRRGRRGAETADGRLEPEMIESPRAGRVLSAPAYPRVCVSRNRRVKIAFGERAPDAGRTDGSLDKASIYRRRGCRRDANQLRDSVRDRLRADACQLCAQASRTGPRISSFTIAVIADIHACYP